MLLATLNHNLPDWTDNLVNQLSRDPMFTDCEMMVVDNGSTEPKAKNTTHTLETNVFFGGGFNVVLDYFLETDHDYLYFLNNDLVFHGPYFIQQSLSEAKSKNAAVYSPSIINASIEQCAWKQMWNWGTGIRSVRWIDFQSPLLRRDILEEIKQFPLELVYGWGLDFYTGIVANKKGFNTVVSDINTIAHMNSLTFKNNKVNIGVDEYCKRADMNMNDYFLNSDNRKLYLELRSYGLNYKG